MVATVAYAFLPIRDCSVTGAGAAPALPVTRTLRPAYALAGAVAVAAPTGETSRFDVSRPRESRTQKVVGAVGTNDICQLPSVATGRVATADEDVAPAGCASSVTTSPPSGSAVPLAVNALPARTSAEDDGATSVGRTLVPRRAT